LNGPTFLALNKLCAPYDVVTAVLPNFLRVNAQMYNLDKQKTRQGRKPLCAIIISTNMTFRIIRPTTKEIIDTHKIMFDLYFKQRIKASFIYCLIGLFFFVLDNSLQNPTRDVWTSFSSFGIAFIYMAIFMFLQSFRTRREYFLGIQASLDRTEFSGSEIIISDDFISTTNNASRSELKWTCFKKYQIHNDSLFLFLDNDPLGSIAIQKTELSPDEFNELLNFVATKIDTNNNGT
jgi:hypothetical protein